MSTAMLMQTSHAFGQLSVTPPEEEALIEGVRRDPPDQAALDALVRRQWPRLFARCRMLTHDPEAAGELAQETWCRVLQARHRLDPLGNVSAYLAVIATNLWRDRARAARRAGALWEDHLWSLDTADPAEYGEPRALAHVVPDPASLHAEERAHLSMDIDRALAKLTPRAREVLVARFIDGESAAEIGRRYGRTEQTVTSWLRQAAGEMRRHLMDARVGRVGASGTGVHAHA
jgi:RNA polymerase sigma-70 factor (ECF subfamily)